MAAALENQAQPQQTQDNASVLAQKPNDKEYNFAQIRQQLEKEKQEKQQLLGEIEQLKKVAQQRFSSQDDDDDDEPYIDKKRLKRELTKVVQQTASETDAKVEALVEKRLSEERKKQWLKENPDFEEVIQHAQKVQDNDPDLADMILRIPNEFDRYKMVYKHIKAMGLHKPPEQKSSVQEKIDSNRRSPYYQPSGVASPGYGVVNGGKDYSPAEGKNAYQKMQELKSRLRLG
jgi:hypothetical protein